MIPVRKKRFSCYTAPACPVEASLELFGGKWKGMILFHLLDGTLRYNELKRLLGNVTQKMLTRQLRELEDVGLITREVYAEIPPKVEYTLTERGYSLRHIMLSLKEWGELYMKEN